MGPPGWATGSGAGGGWDRKENPLSATLHFALDHEAAWGGGGGLLNGRGGWEPPGRTPTCTGQHAEGCMHFWGVIVLCADPDRCGGTPGQ